MNNKQIAYYRFLSGSVVVNEVSNSFTELYGVGKTYNLQVFVKKKVVVDCAFSDKDKALSKYYEIVNKYIDAVEKLNDELFKN